MKRRLSRTPTTFAGVAERLDRNGYPIVPIKKGEKRPLVSDWRSYVFARKDLARYADAGVGVKTGFVTAVDIDIRDARLAKLALSVVVDHLGKSLVRVGQAPKALLVYRIGQMSPKKRSVSVRLPGEPIEARGHAVEVLGDGQQFVAYGIHPTTKKPYTWLDKRDLTKVPASSLPEATVAQTAEMLLELDELLRKHGKPLGRLRQQAEADDVRISANLRADDPERVLDAIDSMPNDDLDYDDWIYIGLALKGALGE